MSATNRLAPADRRDLLADLLEIDPGCRVETARDGYLFVRLRPDVALRFHWYPYPLAAPTEESLGVAVASLLDLALMKLGAVISRGTRRDFVDLYCACRELSLDDVLLRAGDKFGHVGDFPLQAHKALADLSDAESDPMPPLELQLEWSSVRAWALEQAARGGREILDGSPRAAP
jgi:hypothetical protein